MLRLIIGRAGSGKSEAVMKTVEKKTAEGKPCLIVVPEQASFYFERDLALRLKGASAQLAEVKNFKRLCRDVFNECGGGIKRMINDPLRAVLLRQAVHSLGDEIVFYRRHKNDPAFFSLASDVINELKNAGVTSELLFSAAEKTASPLSQAKLRELSLIWAAYERIIEKSFQDGADELTHAARLCENASFFKGKTVFFDGFTGFTEPELQMIGGIILTADEVYCTFCCDDIYSDTDDSFSFVRKNARMLTSLAKKRGSEVYISNSLTELYRFKADGLKAVESFFADGRLDKPSSDGVFLIEGSDLYSEAEAVADEITALVRDEGYDYSDIAVVARDTSRYRFAVKRTFELYGIPLFLDDTDNMLGSPVIRFFLAALSLADGIKTEKLISLLKTSLFDISDEAVDLLSNYAFVWNIDGGAWYAPFTKNPDGLDAKPDTARLQIIESARGRAVELIGGYIESVKSLANREIIKKVYELFEKAGATKLIERLGEKETAEASAALRVIDGLYEILDGEFSAAEIKRYLTLIAAATPLSDIPPSLCEVSFGAANRMRLNNPRAVFVLGLNDGIFPKMSFDAPLLSFSERDVLSGEGVNLSRSFEDSAASEEHFLYRAVTAASERLYLCYAKSNQSGSALSVSAKVAAFLERNAVGAPLSQKAAARFVVNDETALRAYALAAEAKDEALMKAFEESKAKNAALLVKNAASEASHRIANQSEMEKTLGQNLYLSASRIEAYEQCPFSFFMKYIMKVEPLKKAEISPLEAGTFVHSVLEIVMRGLKGDLLSSDEDNLQRLAYEAAEKVIRERMGDLANTNARIGYLLERLKAQSARLLLRLREEQQESDFRPAEFELPISDSEGIKPIVHTLPDGRTVRVVGKIDRVDIMKADEKSYIRVVDYKTGEKRFSLTDVYYGLNIQMLLYLFTVCDKDNGRYENAVPAAVMYMPCDPRAVADSKNAEDEAKKSYRMDGLLYEQEPVIKAMERSVSGVFIPVTLNKDGMPKKTEKLASLEKFGRIKRHIDGIVTELASALYEGKIEAVPTEKSDGKLACDHCDYAAVCRKDRSNKTRKIESVDNLFCEPTSEEVQDK